MSKGFKSFPKVVANPNLKWPFSPSMLAIVLSAGVSNRKRALECEDWIDDIEQHGNVYRAKAHGDKAYLLMFDVGSRLMHCDCRSFEHREGACKHLTAFALRLVCQFEGGTPRFWMRSAILESRNAGDQYKIWERRPSLSEDLAKLHGADIVTEYHCLQEVRGYMLSSGKIWTGALPLPLKGERILAYLPNGEQVPSTVIESIDEESSRYHGYVIHMDWRPDGYEHQETVLFGSEMLRQANVG